MDRLPGVILVLFLRIRRPPGSNRADMLFPYTTRFLSRSRLVASTLSTIIRYLLPVVVRTATPLLWILFETTCYQPRILSSLSSSILQDRSDENTSELQSLMRSSYAVFCLKKTL